MINHLGKQLLRWIAIGLWILLGMSLAQIWVNWQRLQVLSIPNGGRVTSMAEMDIRPAYRLFGGAENEQTHFSEAREEGVEVFGVVLNNDAEQSVALLRVAGKPLEVVRKNTELEQVGRVLEVSMDGVKILGIDKKEKFFPVFEPSVAPTAKKIF